ncbi:MAG: SDR family NAD(P)-dependent oxidoreductase [Acidimicrobiia bacterium]
MGGPAAVIVSGGTAGIGRGITIALAEAGWQVIAFGPDARQRGSTAADGVAATRAALQARELDAVLLDADVTVAADLERVVAAARATDRPVRGLVNNAAIRPRADVLHTDEATWRRTLEVNLTGPFLLTTAALPLLLDAGDAAIVNVGSASAWGRPGLAAYAAAKGGLHGFSAALAYDLQPHGVRVNLVVPGRVHTGMIDDTFPAGDIAPGRYPVTPADVAAAVVYLLSAAAARVNGAVLNVGGHLFQAGP